MKGNNGSGNNEKRDLWETPKDLFYTLNKQYNFKYDCCANSKNRKCFAYSSHFEIIDYKIKYISWMNPPFSKAFDMFKQFFNVIEKGVAIYRCDNMETKVWQLLILPKATWIFFPRGRINYEGLGSKGSRFPSALIGFNVDPPKEILGEILFTNN